MPMDEFHGIGGSYRVNDKGERELVDRTKSAEEVAAEAAAAEAATKPKTKGK